MTAIKDLLEAVDRFMRMDREDYKADLKGDTNVSEGYTLATMEIEAKLREAVENLPELIELLDELTSKPHFGEPARQMIDWLKKWEKG